MVGAEGRRGEGRTRCSCGDIVKYVSRTINQAYLYSFCVLVIVVFPMQSWLQTGGRLEELVRTFSGV